MVEWTNYAVQLSQQLGLGVAGKPKEKIGEYLKVEDLDKFKEDQIVQLYELMKAATLDGDQEAIQPKSGDSSSNDGNRKS